MKSRGAIFFLINFVFLFCFHSLVAQFSLQDIKIAPEKAGGVNYAYPFDGKAEMAAAPKGYDPFYINHFGRHGSRYLTDENDYTNILNVFAQAEAANNLTILGKSVYQRLQIVCNEAKGNAGNLTPLGMQQMGLIAERMYNNFPEVFDANSKVTAVSTTVGRVIKSRELFCSKLRLLNDSMTIEEDHDDRHMKYLNYHTTQAVQFRSAKNTWRTSYNIFEKEKVKPDRLMHSLFINTKSLSDAFNTSSFMFGLFSIAGNIQNTESAVSLLDIFEKQELFNLWQCKNYSLYVQYANATLNGGIMMENAMPLLADMINSVEHAIVSKTKGAALRFGHDGNIIPLAMLMHLEHAYASVLDPAEVCKYWNDFRIAPMAANIQMVFYRSNDSAEILVRFLYNEQEMLLPRLSSSMLPFYRWSDVKQLYTSLLKKPSHFYSQH
jgi:hypothetical protein